MKLRYCPACRKSGKSMTVVRRIFPKPCVYHIECPSCHYCGKTWRLKFLAAMSWNKEARNEAKQS